MLFDFVLTFIFTLLVVFIISFIVNTYLTKAKGSKKQVGVILFIESVIISILLTWFV